MAVIIPGMIDSLKRSIVPVSVFQVRVVLMSDEKGRWRWDRERLVSDWWREEEEEEEEEGGSLQGKETYILLRRMEGALTWTSML